MSRSTLSTRFFSFVLLAAVVRADYFSSDPLANKVVPYDAIPYQVMTDKDDPRGFQTGYNICNSTTETQDSMCQTMFVNHMDDFCLWAPGTPNTTIADSEGEEVAWCSKKGHGTRIIPDGAITSLQMIKTPSYIQISGTLNQNYLNIGGTDGGELDSGGQDGEGNPMGGLVYTNAFKSSNGNNGTYAQAQHWSFFIGDSAFCGKICDQTGSNPQGLCNNIYDRLGCEYNAPANVEANTFEYCLGDDMMPVGTYVGSDGQTSTYFQPAESVSIDYDALPYTPTPAPTSSCTQFASAAIFTDGVGVTVAAGNGVGAAATGASGSAPTSGAATGSGTGSGTAAKATGTGTAKATGSGSGASPSASGKSGAAALGVSAAAVMMGVVAVVAAL
ncbi:hypothetical protein MSAN_02138400 [Mycena sanguinolenta]|uniref:Macrofage activating glycoprotein n=1 Tax=Mycena sanguinolenta TaxID=230812 RepID=A0A8H6XH98_9AGAR|nr:hypothetical protein MSAN_02138400 [Mycena sanguinolenta]